MGALDVVGRLRRFGLGAGVAVSALMAAALCPFPVVDKIGARIFLFKPGGQMAGSAPSLLGLSRGDSTAADNRIASRLVGLSSPAYKRAGISLLPRWRCAF